LTSSQAVTSPAILIGCLLAALTWGAPISVAAGPTAGRLAPPIEGETLRHVPFSLATERGNVVLLQFWASWCVSCIDALPDLQTLRAEHAEQGFEIVGISLDEDLRDARRAIAEHRVDWPQFCDGKGGDSPLAQRYGVTGTPRYFLIDRDGRLAPNPVARRDLAARVAALLVDD